VYHPAVSTIDLGPTFLDFAGVLHLAPPNMSTLSLREDSNGPSS